MAIHTLKTENKGSWVVLIKKITCHAHYTCRQNNVKQKGTWNLLKSLVYKYSSWIFLFILYAFQICLAFPVLFYGRGLTRQSYECVFFLLYYNINLKNGERIWSCTFFSLYLSLIYHTDFLASMVFKNKSVQRNEILNYFIYRANEIFTCVHTNVCRFILLSFSL